MTTMHPSHCTPPLARWAGQSELQHAATACCTTPLSLAHPHNSQLHSGDTCQDAVPSLALEQGPQVGEEVEELQLLVATLCKPLVHLREEHGAACLREVRHRGLLRDRVQEALHDLLAAVALLQEGAHDLLHLVGGRRRSGEADQPLDLLVGHGTGHFNEGLLVDFLVEGHGGLQHRDRTPHVSLRQRDELVNGPRLELHPLLLADVQQPGLLELAAHQLEAELGASGVQRLDDLGDVIADDDEAGHVHELLHDAAQGRLRVVRHGVGLVQNHHSELGLGAGQARLRRANGQLCEGLDLLAHGMDAAVVGGVELLDAEAPVLAEELLHEGQRHRGLARARGAVEHQVRQLARLQAVPQRRDDFVLLGDVVDALGPVLLHPRHVLGHGAGRGLRRDLHGSCHPF
mmetsp:Transcript_6022/g.17226  ORF Transcript_6022/g.17226 Transcript_6022/m.17226 type:complete len:403 (+) Transcript_6022:22-1230(+)